MRALILLALWPVFEQRPQGLSVKADPEVHYSELWLEDSDVKPVYVGKNEWVFPGVFDLSGTVTLVVCGTDGCRMEECVFNFRDGPPLHLAIMAALLAGFLMNFMPCVLPVIGLKLRAFADPRKRTAYIAGVMASFMVLATLSLTCGTGLSLMGFGHYRETLSVVCFVFGMSLFGVWNVPSFGVSGSWGPFGMGCLTVALGSSCAVPFLGPAMTYTANAGALETYLIFAALGGGFCSPFVLPLRRFIEFFRHYLPLVEVGCAIGLVAVSIWLLFTVSVSSMAMTFMVACLIVEILSLVTVPPISTRKFWVAVIRLALTVCVALTIRHTVGQTVRPIPVEVPGLMEPQVTFVTADWCMNCAAMKPTLQDSRVVQRMSELGIVPKILDYTDRPPEVTEILVASYSRDVPTLRIVTPEGRVTILSGLWTVQAVLDALE